jgi:hypothetical protein
MFLALSLKKIQFSKSSNVMDWHGPLLYQRIFEGSILDISLTNVNVPFK